MGGGAYVEYILSMVDISKLKDLKIVVNAGNGCAGEVVDVLATHLPFQIIRINHEPDGEFPNGVPNPLLPEKRADTAEAVIAHGADFGVAWDGDFDRCFFFDQRGAFIEGYYLVGLIAEALLKTHPGETIIHDPRLTWNTIETVKRCGGQPIVSPTGHSLIKKAMWDMNALYGGEMSAHHYFRDFFNCDSGMIPWLLVAEIVSRTRVQLSEHVAMAMEQFPVSGEINRQVANVDTVLRCV